MGEASRHTIKAGAPETINGVEFRWNHIFEHGSLGLIAGWIREGDGLGLKEAGMAEYVAGKMGGYYSCWSGSVG